MLGLRNAVFRGPRGVKLAASTLRMSSSAKPTITYTETDEAPMLATYSFLPIVRKMVGMSGIDVEKRDISLSGRVLSHFPEKLTDDQKVPSFCFWRPNRLL